MEPWPPRTTDGLERWLMDEMPFLLSHPATETTPAVPGEVEELAEKIARAVASAHQGVSARVSQVQIARTSLSDPTFRTAAFQVDGVRQMVERYDKLAPRLLAYQQAKTVLPERRRLLVEMRYERFLAPGDVAARMGISGSWYRKERDAALERMLASLWFGEKSESGAELERNKSVQGG